MSVKTIIVQNPVFFFIYIHIYVHKLSKIHLNQLHSNGRSSQSLIDTKLHSYVVDSFSGRPRVGSVSVSVSTTMFERNCVSEGV